MCSDLRQTFEFVQDVAKSVRDGVRMSGVTDACDFADPACHLAGMAALGVLGPAQPVLRRSMSRARFAVPRTTL